MWKHIFLANKQVAPLGCSAGSIASYVTGAAAQRGGLEIASGIYVFMWLGAYGGLICLTLTRVNLSLKEDRWGDVRFRPHRGH